jgi:DNA-binding winged helix-turn-helix (wHTH) protein
VFTRYQIVDAVRGEDAEVTERSVDVHVAAIRRKLGEYRDLIETLRGVGYRFRASQRQLQSLTASSQHVNVREVQSREPHNHEGAQP